MTDCRQHMLDNILSIIADLEAPPMVDAETPDNGALQDLNSIEAEWDQENEIWLDPENDAKPLVNPDQYDYIFDEIEDLWRLPDGEEVEAVPMTAYDFIEARALDIEYRISGHDFSCLGAEILITFGGPNIWIDTKRNVVEGAWGSDRLSRGYTDNIGIDEAIAELWEMRK